MFDFFLLFVTEAHMFSPLKKFYNTWRKCQHPIWCVVYHKKWPCYLTFKVINIILYFTLKQNILFLAMSVWRRSVLTTCKTTIHHSWSGNRQWICHRIGKTLAVELRVFHWGSCPAPWYNDVAYLDLSWQSSSERNLLPICNLNCLSDSTWGACHIPFIQLNIIAWNMFIFLHLKYIYICNHTFE